MKEQIRHILSTRLPGEAYEWLEETSGRLQDAAQLHRAFAQVSRKLAPAVARLSGPAGDSQNRSGKETHLDQWSTDRLCRVYLLAAYTNDDAAVYHQAIEQLFVAADVNELVALYAALPVLAYPESWTKRCAEGIRSNIGSVLEAILYHNPYPAAYLEQPAWNQLVLKAFFTDKQLSLITGLQQRTNRELARTLTDYAHERQAAGRTVHPMLWLLIGQFAEDAFLNDFATVLAGADEAAKKWLREGIALSGFLPALELLPLSGTATLPTLSSH